jgi:hypothetical protein
MRSCLKLILIDTTTIGSIEFVGTGRETGSFRACRRLLLLLYMDKTKAIGKATNLLRRRHYEFAGGRRFS